MVEMLMLVLVLMLLMRLEGMMIGMMKNVIVTVMMCGKRWLWIVDIVVVGWLSWRHVAHQLEPMMIDVVVVVVVGRRSGRRRRRRRG